jgi:hypothetical protein
MRYKELLEYKRDITATNLGEKFFEKLTNRDTSVDNENIDFDDPETAINEYLKKVESADPTPNKQYTEWLIRRYIDDSIIMFEDVLSTTADMLERYHTLKVHRKLPQAIADIGRFKTRSQLIDLDYSVSETYNEFIKDKPEVISKGNATEIVNDANFRIIIPHDQEASCYYGQGTRWCTASKNNNMFDDYAKDGTLFIVTPKNPEYTGQKWQLHFCSGQMMDETDSPVTLYDIDPAMEGPYYGKLFAKYDNCSKYRMEFHFREDIGDSIVKPILKYVNEYKDKIIKKSGKHMASETHEDIEKLLAWDLDEITSEVIDHIILKNDADGRVPLTVSEIPTVIADIANRSGGALWNFIYDNFDVFVEDDFSITTRLSKPINYI